MINRVLLILVGAALALALTGCNTAERKSLTAVAQAAEVFDATSQAGDVEVNLRIEPLQIGDNTLVVTVDDPTVAAVEAQVIMASMGHGTIVDMNQIVPGRFEVQTNTLDMGGKWMIRTKVTNSTGQSQAAIFHIEIGTSCLPATKPPGL